MAIVDLALDDSFIGQTIGPAGGGFLVDLTQIKAGRTETPCFSESRQHWVSAYIQLRGSRDFRDLFCLCPSQSPAPPQSTSSRHSHVVNNSLPYVGDLQVRCLPKGSLWEIALSDTALTYKEKNERAKAMARKAIESQVAKLQRKADALAPPEPVPPILIEKEREPIPARSPRRR